MSEKLNNKTVRTKQKKILRHSKNWQIPVAVRSKAYVCGSSIAAVVGPNPAESINVRLLCLLCVV
jgi:hypothetical protein